MYKNISVDVMWTAHIFPCILDIGMNDNNTYSVEQLRVKGFLQQQTWQQWRRLCSCSSQERGKGGSNLVVGGGLWGHCIQHVDGELFSLQRVITRTFICPALFRLFLCSMVVSLEKVLATPPPWFPVLLLHFVHICQLSEMCTDTDENMEYGKRLPSISDNCPCSKYAAFHASLILRLYWVLIPSK